MQLSQGPSLPAGGLGHGLGRTAQTYVSEDTLNDLAIIQVGQSVRVYTEAGQDFYYMDVEELIKRR